MTLKLVKNLIFCALFNTLLISCTIDDTPQNSTLTLPTENTPEIQDLATGQFNENAEQKNVSPTTIEGDWLIAGHDSAVRISIKNEVASGTVVEIPGQAPVDILCTECKDDRKNQQIHGMLVLTGLIRKNDEWGQGKILDPNSGIEYDCQVSLINGTKLAVKPTQNGQSIGLDGVWTRAY